MHLLCTAPGVGILTATSFVATLDRVERFQRAQQVQAYLGLVPREMSSGEKQLKGRITKSGNKRTRYLGGRQGSDQNLLDSTERLPLSCDAIRLSLSANAATFQPGARLNLQLLTQGPGDRAADVYAALLLPDGGLFGFVPDGSLVAGLPALIEGEPIGSAELMLLDVDLPAGLPAGEYSVVAVATTPGADPQNQGAWFHGVSATFQVQAD